MLITDELFSNQDKKYAEFSSSLIPNVENMIGVRSPIAKNIAKKYANTQIGKKFLEELPHKYYDENLVHGYMLGFLKCDVERLQKYIEEFLPYINNWSVCDTCVCGLKNFFKKPDDVYEFVKNLAFSNEPYKIRFALVSMLCYYVKDEYVDEVLEITAKIKSDEYYVKMAQAWLVSVALVKKYDKAVKVIESHTLSPWVHNKSITKGIESYRLDANKKEYLKSLKVKVKNELRQY